MASRRGLKKEIDYLVSEVISNGYTCLYFHGGEEKRAEIYGIIEEAVNIRNDLFERIKPAEKHNRSLVKKHYAALRNDLMVRIDELFSKLSGACSKKA